MKTVRMLVSGIVQGVGFRYFAYKTALKLNITGWVRNLPDGRVEIVAQGKESDLNAYIREIRIGPRMASVRHIDIEEQPNDPIYNRFDITY